jgi:SRSO17 transposase
MTRDEPVQAWIIDDTGFPKTGEHSVGVARQYCGQLGMLANCQVAVSLSLATHQASLPIAYRLYLPKDWADDPSRRAIAGVPEDISFQTKPEIALQQLRQAFSDGVPPAVVLMDPAYGADSKLRAGISELGLAYVAGILPTTMLWRPGEAPLPPVPEVGRGQGLRRHRMRRDATHQPVSAKTLAVKLAADAWQAITWRDGSNTPLTSRFARVRVRPAHDDKHRREPAPEEWLLIEWPEGDAEPDHDWLSTLPPVTAAHGRPSCAGGSLGQMTRFWSVYRRFAGGGFRACVYCCFEARQPPRLPHPLGVVIWPPQPNRGARSGSLTRCSSFTPAKPVRLCWQGTAQHEVAPARDGA